MAHLQQEGGEPKRVLTEDDLPFDPAPGGEGGGGVLCKLLESYTDGTVDFQELDAELLPTGRLFERVRLVPPHEAESP